MFFKKVDQLSQLVTSSFSHHYAVHSRVHPLSTFSTDRANCFVKRDDELSCMISGSKLRKYCSLFSFLLDRQLKQVIVIGGAFSNHVLGISQLLIENKMEGRYFLKGQKEREKIGNLALSSLFIPAWQIRWFAKKEWPDVENIAYEQAKQSKACFVLPEGGAVKEALPGALTLALDIMENEKKADLIFDHIFIDAGTGFTAALLILAFSWLKRTTQIHVILMAQTPDQFLLKLSSYWQQFISFIGTASPLPSPNCYKLYTPELKNFGQTNHGIFDFIARLCRSEGFLTEPIYSAKLFLQAKKVIKEDKLKGNVLIIHSGGLMTIGGFTPQLTTALSTLENASPT